NDRCGVKISPSGIRTEVAHCGKLRLYQSTNEALLTQAGPADRIDHRAQGHRRIGRTWHRTSEHSVALCTCHRCGWASRDERHLTAEALEGVRECDRADGRTDRSVYV